MKKRLAIITTHPIQYNFPLFRTLAERQNIEIRVFYTWGKAALENKYDPGFGKVVEWDIPLLQGYDFQFLENTSVQPGSHHFKGIINPDAVREIDKWQPDAILLYGWSFKSHLQLMRHYKGKIPVFFRGDSTLLNDQSAVKSLIRALFLRWVYSFVDKVFYVGTNNKEYFRRSGVRESQLILAPHAIDNGFFQEKNGYYEQEAKDWRRSLGIEEDAMIFLFAGKFEPNKSPLIMTDAFKKCGFPGNVHLVLVGNGPLESQLREGAQSPNIHFAGFQNQTRMPVVYRLADVVLLPSVSETWGLAINEAMASGRPVIASSRCGGAIDLIKEGFNGSVFNAGDVGQLMDKMKQLYSSRAAIGEMGQNALSHIQQFSIERIAKAIEQTTIG